MSLQNNHFLGKQDSPTLLTGEPPWGSGYTAALLLPQWASISARAVAGLPHARSGRARECPNGTSNMRLTG